MPDKIKVKVKPGYEGKNFMWHGGAVGLAGNRKEFDKLKSGEPVFLPYQIADRLISGQYFVEVKPIIKKAEKVKDKDGE